MVPTRSTVPAHDVTDDEDELSEVEISDASETETAPPPYSSEDEEDVVPVKKKKKTVIASNPPSPGERPPTPAMH